MYRAILKGCIPVTMFRANDLPFARFLGMPYDSFMVNLQPDDYKELNGVLSRILADPARLRRMQVCRLFGCVVFWQYVHGRVSVCPSMRMLPHLCGLL